MSDLAAPILYIMQDEALAFWCFAALMERMEANFRTASTAMQVLAFPLWLDSSAQNSPRTTMSFDMFCLPAGL